TKSMTNMYDGKLVIIDVDQEKSENIILEEVAGLINRISNIAELEVVVAFIYESDQATKLSFRSRGKYNVCDIATKFGGGGHKCASGATVNLPYDQARETVLKSLSKFFVS
ncbi:DHHA1 domain-containing protein, partial [bacterium]|nr:DHHA1 domain-containing protein [bacterium]